LDGDDSCAERDEGIYCIVARVMAASAVVAGGVARGIGDMNGDRQCFGTETDASFPPSAVGGNGVTFVAVAATAAPGRGDGEGAAGAGRKLVE